MRCMMIHFNVEIELTVVHHLKTPMDHHVILIREATDHRHHQRIHIREATVHHPTTVHHHRIHIREATDQHRRRIRSGPQHLRSSFVL